MRPSNTATLRVVPVLAGAQVVEAEFIDAVDAPSGGDLAYLTGRRYGVCGWVRHRLHLPPRNGRPVVLFLYGPCDEITEEDSGIW